MTRVASRSDSLILRFVFLVGLIATTRGMAQVAPPPAVVWQRTFHPGQAYSGQQTSDGGFIVAGRISPARHEFDPLLIKTDKHGNRVWTRTFDDPTIEGNFAGAKVQQTSDGGYALVGSISLLKTGAGGDLLWHESYDEVHELYSVHQTSDGGYILAGNLWRNDKAEAEGRLLKTDSNGKREWLRPLDFADKVVVLAVRQIADGGYIATGEGSGDDGDGFVLRSDQDGNTLWRKALRGRGLSVQETRDGGFIVAGSIRSGNVCCNVFLAKADQHGESQWQATIREAQRGHARAVWQTTDGGYVVTGTYRRFETKADLFVLKTDPEGNLFWEGTFGGPLGDLGYAVQQTSDGGYFVAGFRDNVDERDVAVYMVKLATDSFRRGDTNADGDVNLADPIEMLSKLFAGGGDFPCADAADTDDNGEVNLSDVAVLLNHLFSGGPAPSVPFVECGMDSTLDELICDSFSC